MSGHFARERVCRFMELAITRVAMAGRLEQPLFLEYQDETARATGGRVRQLHVHKQGAVII